jgi:Zn-dependent protease
VHAEELQSLSRQARHAEERGDWHGARAAWDRALGLLPTDTTQYRGVLARITEIDARLAAASEQPSSHSEVGKWVKRLGPIGVVLLFAFTKGKLLLLGLTKLSTLLSMLATLGLFWTWYGWKFALGFVLSIYIHEMGHVAALRRYGIPATAPMFVPGLGAFVTMRQRPATVAQEARVGLAGPIWGLGATAAAWAIGLITSEPIWFAIANASAWINVFNLIPVWQLDGGRAFHAFTRQQRFLGLGVAALMWLVARDGMLLLLTLGAGYRSFTKDASKEADWGAFWQFVGILALLALLFLMTTGASRPA